MKIPRFIQPVILPAVILVLLSGHPKVVKSQQDPIYTQYLTNLLSIQPAYAGISGVLTISALSRAQWVGFLNILGFGARILVGVGGCTKFEYIYDAPSDEVI
jgi:threonine/homoserine efflux transporter RhtA